MKKQIANTYKIIKEIGSGGGGIIYLAEHTRLQKNVVLKADKRSLRTNIEALRHEVDSLKNLNNKYIPKVYDFVIEDDVVYTVMDYIEGKSFDFYVKENIKFSQSDVIKWTKQILEALHYLHSRPPHGILHADIKPANIMLTPEGEAVLIDFNIALALGEDGAIPIGRSHGYASPEHYGLDYTNFSKNDYLSFKNSNIKNSNMLGVLNKTEKLETETNNKKTEILDGTFLLDKTEILEGEEDYITEILMTETLDKTEILKQHTSSNIKKSYRNISSKTTAKKIKLDKTSDIYNLGATIYHILTGIKPAANAFEVNDIDESKYSHEFIKIINKAMQPDSTLRYQSAAEMLNAVNNIHKTDKRSRKLKHKFMATIFLSITCLTLGLATTFVGLKQMENLQKSLTLAEYSSKALVDGEKEKAIDYALQSLNNDYGIFSPPVTAEGQKALTDALGLYDLKDDYKLDGVLNLPSAPLYLEISKNGKFAIAGYSKEFIIFSTTNNKILHTFKTGESALYKATFLGDNTVVYTSDGGVICFDFKNEIQLWNGDRATSLAVSENGQVIATVFKDDNYTNIYDAKTGEVLKQISFGDRTKNIMTNDIFVNPNNDIFELNYDGTKLGVSFGKGELWVYDLLDSENDIEIFDDTSTYKVFDGGFNSQYFAFSATNNEESLFAVIDTELFLQTGGFDSNNKYTVEANSDAIYVQTENILVEIDSVSGEQTPLVNTNTHFSEFAISENVIMIETEKEYILFDNNANKITSIKKESGANFFDINNDIAIIGSFNENKVKTLKYNSHNEKNIFEYDTKYEHDEARVSEKYNTLMLFMYDSFQLLDKNGILAEVEIPNSDNVYDQQYRRFNKDYLEVKYYDGTIINYSAKDGSIINEKNGEKPNTSLDEYFETTNFIIKSPLHGNPKVYKRENEKFIKEIENEGYLTYITEVEGNIVAQYITTDDFIYGVLFNSKFEKIAYLPYLSDVVDGELIFDMPTGKIRKSKIFSLDELIDIASLD